MSAWNLVRLRGAVSAGSIPLYDFIEYWSAGRLFLAGRNPYSSVELLAVQQSLGWKRADPLIMWNPPWTLVLLLPFARLPYWIGRAAFTFLEVALIVAAAEWLWRQAGGSERRRWIAWLTGVLFVPCMEALYLGQSSPLVLAGLVGFLWALERKCDFIAGLFILAIAAKPHVPYLFWIFLLFWIWQDARWRVLAGAGVALSSALGLVLAVNPSAISGYLETLESGPGPLLWKPPSLGVALMLLVSPGLTSLRFVPTLLGILCAFGLCWHWRSVFSWRRYLDPILLLSVLSSSFTWMYDWVVLLPLVILLLVWTEADPGRNWWVPAVLFAMQLLIIFMECIIKDHNDFYNLWVPPALWLLYWLAQPRQAQPRCLA
ncbi:MAG: DUF2029 domain-containing protein [Acidobacteria bacterium]|nr:DUF2029 domain-containing protein [Acidobacteriota bacterium]